MRDVLAALFRHAEEAPSSEALSFASGAGRESLDYGGLAGLVAGTAASLERVPARVGLLLPRGAGFVAADLALALLGRWVVPLPEFFSEGQLLHIAADSGIEAIVSAPPLVERARALGLPVLVPEARSDGPRQPVGGSGRIIYTSGTTGRPKGVLLGEAQVGASVAALAEASKASAADRNLSVLPFALLLEQLAGLYVPFLAGASVHLCDQPTALPEAAEAMRPTTTVLVPELLAGWVAWLKATGRRAPDSLRFVAVGGATVPPVLADEAWSLGIPVHEGYGLSECCSVVAVNRPGERVSGTVGRPLAGLDVRLEEGEIVVAGPTVMDGYLNGPPAGGRWRTGDLGAFDGEGRLIVHGRKDDLIVTTTGRNVHPEWIEPLLKADARIARAAVVAGGSHPCAVVVPSPKGENWFAGASEADRAALVAALTAECPDYARPGRLVVIDAGRASEAGLFTLDGRPRRRAVAAYLAGEVQ